MQRHALIVAGGSGSRMASSTPKQFLLLDGKPILMHTIDRFNAISGLQTIILVLPPREIGRWQSLCDEYEFTTAHKVVEGGDSRFQSVKNGLVILKDTPESLVAIHDGVRPLVTETVILQSFEEASARGNAIAAVAIKDSIRQVDNTGNNIVDRSTLRSIQTPQTFKTQLIKAAYAIDHHASFTDDASVMEAFGDTIHLFPGDYKNIKITTPEDLIIAEAFLKK